MKRMVKTGAQMFLGDIFIDTIKKNESQIEIRGIY